MNSVEFLKFTTTGYLRINRSAKFRSGIWLDMTIEQTNANDTKQWRINSWSFSDISDSILALWT